MRKLIALIGFVALLVFAAGKCIDTAQNANTVLMDSIENH